MQDQTNPSDKTPAMPLQPTRPRRRWLRIVLIGLGALIVLVLVGIQFVPVNRANPPVTTTVKWDSPQSQALFTRACADCHSDQTSWPWYSYVAPVSWLVYYDVVRGRSEWNVSTLGAPGGGGRDFGAQRGDLAFQFGAILAGQGRLGGDRRGGFDGGNRPPGGQFPPNGGQPPQNGGQFPNGGQSSQPRDGGFGGGLIGRVTEQINNGSMPPANYTILHPSAVLTDAERQQLLAGLKALFQASQGG